MLRSLDIKDMLIIDRLSLEFGGGLNVLTGETGAGKSILLDSLGFVLGWRGRAELVRQGAKQGEVTAVFELPEGHPARTVLAEYEIEAEDGELILRRVNTRDGRKTAWVNGTRVTGEVLRALSDTLLELHGQHDDRGLLDVRGHLALLDAFAGADTSEVRRAWRALSAAQKALAEAEAKAEEARAEEDFLRYATDELDKLDPQPGEDEALDSARRLMQNAERIKGDVARAFEAIGPQGAEGQMMDATRWLDGAAEGAGDALGPALDALSRAMIELGEVQAGVEACLDRLSFDPRELEETEERLFAIRAAARKHGVAPDDLPAFAADLRSRLDLLDASGGELSGLRAAVADARAAFDAAAAALTARRQEAAARLDRAMAAELAPLKMDRATFTTLLEPGTPGPTGVDSAAFEVATNPGAPSGPLNKIASGGELSRFLLALKVCLTGGDRSMTLIFDEIDRGVGGATADAVGRRLKALAEGGQVLVVTHSPQVAALGAHHWRVEKRVAGEVTTSTVVPVAKADRVDEIARMLAGDTITDAARGAAQALLDAAA
ncbi:DNA repair protein RecN [Jannaschia seohaensis]|uniref:DNA repair protein RecN n=1 Tax=Jannaschia seohaensis TaxID=475081 RepID=A0A2Y9AFZ3_9RHOB|nr:DNA repair protein RecN [Jannaschia seohaensis]PWJ21069.1 DNA repair protein RecN (Recombination protein N) [Jannaschia seohaensis]SSA41479.1 DNA repair protein RecN (Recombination protein N) [Jannaschia seohaensis]